MAKFVVNSKKFTFEQNNKTKWLAGRSLHPIMFTVRFNTNGGNAVSQVQSYKVGDKYKDLPSPTFTAHKFTGWLNRSNQVVADGAYADFYSQTLSASWINSTNITWDASTNGGTLGSTAGMYWYAGYAFGVLPDATHPTLTFDGWYTAASGGTKIGTSDIFSGQQTTYYAQFTSYNDPIGNVICPTANITFTNSGSYPWSYDDTTGYDSYKCYQDIYSNDGSYSILQGSFSGSGTLYFDVYCDTETSYDGLYVIVDNSDGYYYQKWQEVVGWEGGAASNGSFWGFTGPVGWTYDCSIDVGSGDHIVEFVFGNDCNDGSGSCEYFGKSTVLVKNVRFV